MMADATRTWSPKGLGCTMLVGMLTFVLVGCPSPPSGPPPGAPDADATVVVPVETAQVETGDMRRLVSASTTLRARLEMPVVSEMAGTVVHLSVDRGDRVRRGEVIARIDNEDAAIALAEARMLVTRYERELEAIRPLFEAGYLARQQWDEVTFQRDQARTQVRRAERTRTAQTVRAPRDGVVLERLVEQGALVVPNQSLLMLADVDDLEAVISVPERELAALREGQPAELMIDALGGASARGVVERIEPIVDPRTGTVDVRVRLLDPVERDDAPRIRPGMFVQVRVTTDVRTGVPTLIKRAIVYEGDRAWAWRVEPVATPTEDSPVTTDRPHRTVRRVPLELGYEESARVEVRGGLGVGDEIVVAGQNALSEDAIVVVVPPRALRESAAPGDALAADPASAAGTGVDAEPAADGDPARMNDAEAAP